ncbi:MAG TPA: Pr6Pr family membrane protein [Methylocella sp.]|nr:Pr6Pr family membrane protein [Methylocella sp.]
MLGETNASGEMSRGFYLERGCAAAIASMTWFALAVQLCFDIQEAVSKNHSIAVRVIDFLSFFTIETNLVIALVLTILCTQPGMNRFLSRPDVKSALVVYIVIVGVVYELLLRHLWHPQGLQLLADMLLHDIVPLLYCLFWLVFVPKGSLRWSDAATWLVYPIAFFVYSMLRGVAFGIYPYPFIDAARLGFAQVSVNAMILLALFFGLGIGVTAIDRALASDDRGRSGLGTAAEL